MVCEQLDSRFEEKSQYCHFKLMTLPVTGTEV